MNTKVPLRFDLENSPSLSDYQEGRIRRCLANRISKYGVLQVAAMQHRAQKANRDEALQRFTELLAAALVEKRRRRKTRTGGKGSDLGKNSLKGKPILIGVRPFLIFRISPITSLGKISMRKAITLFNSRKITKPLRLFAGFMRVGNVTPRTPVIQKETPRRGKNWAPIVEK